MYPLCTHHRHIFENFRRRLARRRDPSKPPPIKKPKSDDDDEAQRPQIGSGGLAPGSSIIDEVDTHRKKEAAQERPSPLKVREPVKYIDPTTIKRTQKDPHPVKRVQWLQKMATRLVRHRGRLSKGDKILRTERFDVSKSPFFKTSVKKLGPLARQIAGKPLEEAMVQMRFSKKLVARDVLKHLEYARNKAIAEKRMGIGLEIPTPEGVAKKEGEQLGEGRALVIEDKKGKRRKIEDPSSMYVDQAWVGRGKYQFGTDYRARGRAHKLHLPYTSEFPSFMGDGRLG